MTADLQPLFKCKYKTSADSQQKLENDDCKELVKDLLSDQHLNLAHTVCHRYSGEEFFGLSLKSVRTILLHPPVTPDTEESGQASTHLHTATLPKRRSRTFEIDILGQANAVLQRGGGPPSVISRKHRKRRLEVTHKVLCALLHDELVSYIKYLSHSHRDILEESGISISFNDSTQTNI